MHERERRGEREREWAGRAWDTEKQREREGERSIEEKRHKFVA